MEIHTVPPGNLARLQDPGNSPCLVGAILEQHGYFGRRPRASIREHPGPGGTCQVPPQRPRKPGRSNTRGPTLHTGRFTAALSAGRAEYSGLAEWHHGLTWGTYHLPSQRMLRHTHMQTGYMQARAQHTSQAGAQRGQGAPTACQTKLDMGPSFGEVRSEGPAFQSTSVAKEANLPTCSACQPGVNHQRTDPNSAQPCSVSQVLLVSSRLSARGHGDGWTWNVESKVRLKMG